MSPRPRHKLWVWVAVVSCVLALLGTSLAAVLERAQRDEPRIAPGAVAEQRGDESHDEDERDDDEGDEKEEDDDEDEDDEEEDESDEGDDESSEDDEDERGDVGGDEVGTDGDDATDADAASTMRAIAAAVETDPVAHDRDAADDAAIWRNPTHPGSSAIVATDKQGALVVYDLSGRRLHELRAGEPNNVDLRAGIRFNGRVVTLVAASDRATNRIALYRLDHRTRRLAALAPRPVRAGIDVYGLCLYRSAHSGRLFAFVTSEAGELEQWELVDAAGTLIGRHARSVDVGSQSEGCVADDERAHVYVGEEQRGIWKYGAEPSAGSDRRLVDAVGERLVADVEGLTIARTGRRTGFLLASSQGNNTFVAYRREGSNDYVATFEIAGRRGIDAVEDTDGIDVTTARLGRGPFRDGLFVAQDGGNGGGNQNFKLVPWRSMHAVLRAG